MENLRLNLRMLLLAHFKKTGTIRSFKNQYPHFPSREVNEMRAALLRSGDLETIWGSTRDKRYKTSPSGLAKLNEKSLNEPA